MAALCVKESLLSVVEMIVRYGQWYVECDWRTKRGRSRNKERRWKGVGTVWIDSRLITLGQLDSKLW